MEIEGLNPPFTYSLWFLSHQTFSTLFPVVVLCYVLFYTISPFSPISQNVFIASLERSGSAVRDDTGVWFVRVSVIQRSIRLNPGTPGGLGLCLGKPLTEAKPLSEKPLRAQQAQKNEPPLSIHIRSSATVADPPQTPSHSTAVCPSLWTRDS